MKVRDITRRLEAEGWRMLPRTAGSHRHYTHPTKPGRVTINGEPGDDLTKRLLNSISKQAGWK
ncbi:type II toxin-antitoxin system HicA family toxin [uncultured Paludibaculum sp.]|uniref:type II toxin-antitoxin system HicA family toxin n=1 Tax=uncultured Paludibaculum sp. TaxID=1765020 RepID=UPI00374DA498